MTTPGEESPERPAIDSSYGEIAPGVPRYGQYAPAGWEPPQEIKDAQKAHLAGQNIPPAAAYPGFAGGAAGTSAQPTSVPGKVLTARG